MSRCRPRCARLATSLARRPVVPRRCGWFDAVVVRYAARVNGLTGLAVTKLDVLDTLDRIAICTGYEVDGELLHGVSRRPRAARCARCRCTSGSTAGRLITSTARTLEDLPPAARAYLDRIEALCDVADRVS